MARDWFKAVVWTLRTVLLIMRYVQERFSEIRIQETVKIRKTGNSIGEIRIKLLWASIILQLKILKGNLWTKPEGVSVSQSLSLKFWDFNLWDWF